MTGAPRVSICIPAYARPAELRQAIESVVGQGFGDVEVVVGDDSGDLQPIVEAISDARVRYFRNPERLGMAGNWNAVLDRARGDLLGLLMDDDRLCAGFLEQVVGRFDADPGVGIVFTDHYFDAGRGLERRRCELPGGRYEHFLAPLIRHKPVSVSAAVMRREVWRELRPASDLHTADIVMHMKAAEAGVVFEYIDEPLMIYRSQHDQLTADIRFRDHDVRAWELFEFAEPEAERLRRERLSRALATRASMHLRAGRSAEATADVGRAAGLGRLGARGRTIRFLAGHPGLGPIALRALSRTGLIASGEGRSQAAGR